MDEISSGTLILLVALCSRVSFYCLGGFFFTGRSWLVGSDIVFSSFVVLLGFSLLVIIIRLFSFCYFYSSFHLFLLLVISFFISARHFFLVEIKLKSPVDTLIMPAHPKIKTTVDMDCVYPNHGDQPICVATFMSENYYSPRIVPKICARQPLTIWLAQCVRHRHIKCFKLCLTYQHVMYHSPWTYKKQHVCHTPCRNVSCGNTPLAVPRHNCDHWHTFATHLAPVCP